MNIRKLILLFLALFCPTVIKGEISKAEELKNLINSINTSDYVFSDNDDQLRDELLSPKDAEGDQAGLRKFLIDTGIFYGILWGGRLFYVRNKNSRIFDTSFSKWIDNITEPPVVDDGDGFVTNYVYHPIFGALYYLFYRARGHSVWASAVGSALMSTLFEYTIEGLVETPSLPDLIATPGVGVPMGVIMDNLSQWLVERDNIPAKTAGYIINPARIFIRNGKFGVLNPLTGAFAFHSPFTITPNKSRALNFAYPFFIESPAPLGRAMASFEVLDLKKEFGGQFIFYSIRVDFTPPSSRYGVYLQYPYAGVESARLDGEEISDGFEFSNIRVGGKLLAFENEYFALSGGLEVIPPTAFKDNVDRLATIVNFRRDFPLYLTDATTITPYVSAGLSKGSLSLLGNLGMDLVFNAGNLEGDEFEARIKYGTAVGADISVPTSPSLFFEFNGYTFVSSSNVERTDLFITPGIRFGKRFAPGVGVQVPLTGSSSDIANASVIVDMQARF